MQSDNLKLRISWTEWNPFADRDLQEDELEERSLVSNQYYSKRKIFIDSFTNLVAELQKKHNVSLDWHDSAVFYELIIANEIADGSAEVVAQNILSELEQHLES